MLGHSSLQMIFTKYYAWMPKERRNDGSAMMKAFKSIQGDKVENAAETDNPKVIYLKRRSLEI
jgi:integrase